MRSMAMLVIICVALAGCGKVGNGEGSVFNTLPEWPLAESNKNGISKDFEDQSCEHIPYQNRTVCRIQVHLNSLQYNAGPEDGLMGPLTKGAIKRFQADKNIQPIDGKPSYALLTQLRKDNLKGASPFQTGIILAGACAGGAALFDLDVAAWALGCGASGAILQHMANKGREKYAMRYYEIKDDNERTEQKIKEVDAQTHANERQAKKYDQEIKQLIAKEKDDKQFLAKAHDLRTEMNEELRSCKTSQREAEIKIAILESQINDVNTILKEKPNEEEFQNTLAELQKQKSKLVEVVNTSNGVEKDLLAQKNILDNEIVKRS